MTAAASLSEALPATATNAHPISPTLNGPWAGNRAVKRTSWRSARWLDPKLTRRLGREKVGHSKLPFLHYLCSSTVTLAG